MSHNPSTDTSEVYRMRISSGGSLEGYVKFALKFLQDHPGRPLTIHTIPPTSVKPPAEPIAPKRTSTLGPALLTAPRLISVVEIVKREYIAALRGSVDASGKGKHRVRGIWQYTESGQIDHGEDEKTGEAMDLTRVLEGNSKPKLTHKPYLQITLSTRPLGWEERHNVTCQYVLAGRHRRSQSGRKAEKDGDAVGKDGVRSGKQHNVLPSPDKVLGTDSGQQETISMKREHGKKRTLDSSQTSGDHRKRSKTSNKKEK